MPTDAFGPLLDRDAAIANAQPLIDHVGPLLTELVNHATMAFRRITAAADNLGGVNEDVAALVSYRHMIEMLDGTDVLMRAACSEATIPLLRSAFESLLAIDYILQADYTRRSLSWLCVNVHSRIQRLRSLDGATRDGGGLVTSATKEYGRALVTTVSDDQVTALSRVLRLPNMVPIEAEYQHILKKRRGRNAAWFQLFDGPGNRRLLARAVNRETMYLMLYGPWSSFAHGEDMATYVTSGKVESDTAFASVRSVHQMQFLTNMAVPIMLDATKLMLGRFRNGESLSSWYDREIKPRWDAMRELHIRFNGITLP